METLLPPVRLITLNEERLRESCGDDAEVIAEVITDYRNSVPALFAKIATAIEARDREGVQFAAHTMKGSSRTVGAEALAFLCDRMETAIRQGGFTQARSDLDRAKTEWTRVEAAFERVL